MKHIEFVPLKINKNYGIFRYIKSGDVNNHKNGKNLKDKNKTYSDSFLILILSSVILPYRKFIFKKIEFAIFMTI